MCAICRNSAGPSGRGGFTLLEVLIAVTLLAILASALYGSYFAVLRARERSAQGMEGRRELAATLDLIRREVSSALYSRDDKRLRFVVEDRDRFGKPFSTLELTCLTPPAGSPRRESGTSNVRYRMLEKGERRMLVRQERDAAQERDGAAYPQMERITSFLVECYDGTQWVRSWDTVLNNSLPQRVRVTVQVEEEGKTVEFSMYATPMVRGA